MRPSRIFRIAVAVGLTAFIIWSADPRTILATTAQADVRWLGAAVLLVFIDRALMAWRWIDLLCALTPGSRPPFAIVLRTFFVSTFVGSFLPSIGGDAYRAYSLAKHDVRLSESAASVLMDRVLGALAIAFVGAIAVVLSPRADIGPAIVVPLVAAALGVRGCWRGGLQRFGGGAGTSARDETAVAVGAARRRVDDRRHAPLLEPSRRAACACCWRRSECRRSACFRPTASAAQSPSTCRSFTYFLLIPIVLLVMLLPITVSGLGTSQAAFSFLFGQVGVAAPQAVALSILFVALGIVGNLPGSILYAFEGGARRREGSR